MGAELKRRIVFTLVALLIYRLGTWIPLPGINPSVWSGIFRSAVNGPLGSLNLLSGGGIRRLAIFSLGILPYLSAAYILQIAMVVSRRFRSLQDKGEPGRATIVRYTRYLAALLAILQAYGIAGGLEGIPGLVADPGWIFVITTVVTLTGGTMFLVWLSEQITSRGIGNGIALLLFTGFATGAPALLANGLGLGTPAPLSGSVIVAVLAFLVAATAFIVLMEKARLDIAIRYGRREAAGRASGERSSALRLKLNNAGLMPFVLASWLLLMVVLLATLAAYAGSDRLAALADELRVGRPLYLIVLAVFIVLGTLFYAAFVLDPDETAKSLGRHGGAVEGIAPGEATAAHIDRVASRITAIGAAYLVVVFVMPEILVGWGGVPFYFGGMSLLVMVCTVLDLDAQVRGMSR